jgi:hypothetical protein
VEMGICSGPQWSSVSQYLLSHSISAHVRHRAGVLDEDEMAAPLSCLRSTMRWRKGERWLLATPLLVLVPCLLVIWHHQIYVFENIGAFTSRSAARSKAVRRLSQILTANPIAKTIVVRYEVIPSSTPNDYGELNYDRRSRQLYQYENSSPSMIVVAPNSTEASIHNLAKRGKSINYPTDPKVPKLTQKSREIRPFGAKP